MYIKSQVIHDTHSVPNKSKMEDGCNIIYIQS